MITASHGGMRWCNGNNAILSLSYFCHLDLTIRIVDQSDIQCQFSLIFQHYMLLRNLNMSFGVKSMHFDCDQIKGFSPIFKKYFFKIQIKPKQPHFICMIDTWMCINLNCVCRRCLYQTWHEMMRNLKATISSLFTVYALNCLTVFGLSNSYPPLSLILGKFPHTYLLNINKCQNIWNCSHHTQEQSSQWVIPCVTSLLMSVNMSKLGYIHTASE